MADKKYTLKEVKALSPGALLKLINRAKKFLKTDETMLEVCKKYGEDIMYDCYIGELSDEDAAKFMKQTEEVADEFAGRKIRQLQKKDLISKNFRAPQMYKNLSIQYVSMMVQQYKNQMRRMNINSPEKVSEYFYNMVKSDL